MNIYNQNIQHLLYQKEISISEFSNEINIAKQLIMEPTPNELIRIANYFNLSIDALLTRSISKQNLVQGLDIKLLILDVDGTMTDGGMYFTENGDQFKKYNTKDGMAIKNITKNGIQVGIISHGHKTKVVKDRADLLGIQKVYVGREDKTTVLKEWCKEMNINLSQVAYIGDDINDSKVMQEVGISACPADSVKLIKKVAHIILEQKGGDACVREFIDNYILLTE
jgi:YrbI family 3-deoxy-D-manno-octulosonate 8-phosphate phosphatase